MELCSFIRIAEINGATSMDAKYNNPDFSITCRLRQVSVKVDFFDGVYTVNTFDGNEPLKTKSAEMAKKEMQSFLSAA